MNSINKSTKALFFTALFLSIFLPIGILMTVFGAIYIEKLLIVMILGIMFTVAGVYVMPILWVFYGEKRSLATLVNAVNEEHIYTVYDLSVRLGKSESGVKRSIEKVISQGYLTGFLFDGKTLSPNFNKDKRTEKVNIECQGCGAKYSYLPSENSSCPYCGTLPTKK